MGGVGDGIGEAFVALFILGMLIVGLIWSAVSIFSKDEIRSTIQIKPRIELVINDNKVDTVYVYSNSK
jgi:hypothetical protein